MTRALGLIRTAVKRFPGIQRLLKSHRYKVFRHWLVEVYAIRRNELFTRFMRARGQFRALAGPVIENMREKATHVPLLIVVLGCSTGAEAFSISSYLHTHRQGIEFQVRGYDIVDEVIAKAKSGFFSTDEVRSSTLADEEFIRATFDEVDGGYMVKPEIARRTSFDRADLFDPEIADIIGQPDVLFVQNVLINFERKRQIQAFNRIMSLMKPGSYLFIDGMDLDLRSRLTRRYGLHPLDYHIEEIHKDACVNRGCGWPYVYWGLEPFSAGRRDHVRRYATIFTL